MASSQSLVGLVIQILLGLALLQGALWYFCDSGHLAIWELTFWERILHS